jgi:hypothetical protein
MGGHNRRIWLGGKRKGHANETFNSAIWLECQFPDYVAEPKFADAGFAARSRSHATLCIVPHHHAPRDTRYFRHDSVSVVATIIRIWGIASVVVTPRAVPGPIRSGDGRRGMAGIADPARRGRDHRGHRAYIEPLGGRLHLVASFGDHTLTAAITEPHDGPAALQVRRSATVPAPPRTWANGSSPFSDKLIPHEQSFFGYAGTSPSPACGRAWVLWLVVLRLLFSSWLSGDVGGPQRQ